MSCNYKRFLSSIVNINMHATTMRFNEVQLRRPIFTKFRYMASFFLSHLDKMCSLDITLEPPSLRLSTIICTIGPSSENTLTMQKMIERGMSIARLNFSHGTYEYYSQVIRNIRIAEKNHDEKMRLGTSVAIALDTKGPEIRTGIFGGDSSKEVYLERGNTIILTTNVSFKEKGTASKLFVDYANITKVVKPGNKVFLDDGVIMLVVNHVESDQLICTIENGGIMSGKRGVNLPGVNVDLPAVTEKDKRDLQFGVEHGVDIIFASFIRNADGIREIRNLLGEKGKDIKIVAKIENYQGWMNLDEIIKESDGIMVARGDLGIEIPTEKVFVAQKATVARCNKIGKPVIIATQMLDSMITRPRPSRAESSDVANAVLDGADCVMLSGETAKGKYPLECVSTMDRICREAEPILLHDDMFRHLGLEAPPPLDIVSTIAIAAVEAAMKCKASAIICTSSSGNAARMMSKYRPLCPIISITRDIRNARQHYLYRGVFPLVFQEPFQVEWLAEVDARLRFALKIGTAYSIFKANDMAVVVSNWRRGVQYTNTVRIVYAQEYLQSQKEVLAPKS